MPKIRKVFRIILMAGSILVLLGTLSFILLMKFYPPLRLSLFGGEIPISFDDIQFWVKKVPERNYYRVRAKYLRHPENLSWWGHTIFFAGMKGPLGFDYIFFNPEDNKIYGGGSEIEGEWEWAFYFLGEGKIEGEVFKPAFPKDTRFNFIQGGTLEITSAPRDYIKIYSPGILKKIEKEELEKGVLAEIVKDVTRKK